MWLRKFIPVLFYRNSPESVIALPLARCAAVIPPPPLPGGRSSCGRGAACPPFCNFPPVGRAERAKERPWAGSSGAGLSRGRAGARAAAWALLSAMGGVRRIAGPQSSRAGRPQSAPALWGAWLTPGACPNARSPWPGFTTPALALTNPARSRCAPRRGLARARRNKT